jgi:hypothetical protein
VEYFLQPQDQPWPAEDPYFSKAGWRAAEVLPPPPHWGGGLPEGKLPPGVLGFDVDTGAPLRWPMRNSMVHWRAVLADLAPGRYELRCRSIDANGAAQPMPRPLPKSGHNAIQRAAIVVEA